MIPRKEKPQKITKSKGSVGYQMFGLAVFQWEQSDRLNLTAKKNKKQKPNGSHIHRCEHVDTNKTESKEKRKKKQKLVA